MFRHLQTGVRSVVTTLFKVTDSARTFNHPSKALIVTIKFAPTRNPSPAVGTTTQPLLFLSFAW